jgi:hypothetical protein
MPPSSDADRVPIQLQEGVGRVNKRGVLDFVVPDAYDIAMCERFFARAVLAMSSQPSTETE